MVATSFRARLHALQRCCRLGLLLAGAGLLGLGLLPFVPALVTSTLGLGFALTLGGSFALGALECPSCGHPFCGPRHGGRATPRASIFTHACRCCGDLPE